MQLYHSTTDLQNLIHSLRYYTTSMCSNAVTLLNVLRIQIEDESIKDNVLENVSLLEDINKLIDNTESLDEAGRKILKLKEENDIESCYIRTTSIEEEFIDHIVHKIILLILQKIEQLKEKL